MNVAFDSKQLYGLQTNNRHYHYIFILLFAYIAIIDSINGFILNSTNSQLSIGQFFRFATMLVLGFFLLKSQNIRRISWIFFILYGLVAIQFFHFFFHSNLMGLIEDFLHISKLIYLILIIEVFKNLYIKKLIYKDTIERIFKISTFLFPLSIVIPKIFGLGYYMYESSNAGYSGFFYASNDLNIVMLLLLTYSLFNTFKSKSILNKYLLSSFLNILSLVLIGSKSSAFAGSLILVIYLLKYLVESGLIKKIKIIAIFVLMITSSIVIVDNFYKDEVSQALERHTYFFTKDVVNNNSITSFILTNRNNFLFAASDSLRESQNTIYRVIFGAGYYQHSEGTGEMLNQDKKSIEMDFFDTIFIYGSVGTVFLYIYFSIYFIRVLFLKRFFLKEYFPYVFGFFIIAGYSFLGGHVLYSALSGTFLSLICCMLFALRKDHFDKESDKFEVR